MKRIGCFDLGLENIEYAVVPLLVCLWYGTSDHVNTGANPFGNIKEEGGDQGPQSPSRAYSQWSKVSFCAFLLWFLWTSNSSRLLLNISRFQQWPWPFGLTKLMPRALAPPFFVLDPPTAGTLFPLFYFHDFSLLVLLHVSFLPLLF